MSDSERKWFMEDLENVQIRQKLNDLISRIPYTKYLPGLYYISGGINTYTVRPVCWRECISWQLL